MPVIALTEALGVTRVPSVRAGRTVALDPAVVLAELEEGPFTQGLCAPPPENLASHWLRAASLPMLTPGAMPPFERMFTALKSASSRLDIVVSSRPGDGILLYLGTFSEAERVALQVLLSPECDVAAAPTPTLAGPTLVGVVYRLQAETSRVDGSPRADYRFLDQVSAIVGEWSVLWRLEGVGQPELRVTTGRIDELAQYASGDVTSTTQRTQQVTSTIVSARWTRVQTWLDMVRGHVAHGRAIGLWRVSTWATASSVSTLSQVVAMIEGAVAEDQGRWFASRDLDFAAGASAQPDPTTILTSRDVAAVLAPPSAGIPGIRVRLAPPAHRRPLESGRVLRLGSYWGTSIPATIGVDDLEGHVFLTGTTGAGKSTSLHRLLAEAWNEHHVPFLLIDPVKDAYSDVAQLFRGGLRVVTGTQLCMNIIEPWPGLDERYHLAQVSQAFRGAFTMPSPAPYVVTQLFDMVAMQTGGVVGTDLHDIRDALEPLVDGLGYAGEARANITAALKTRLNVLLAPVRAHRFSWPDSSMVNQLFDQPTVVTLADLVDDEERAFVVLLLALATWARARGRAKPRAVEHLLVLEEAHRVIPEVPEQSADSEAGSAKAVSATLLAAMLAEVRGYGEQVVVVDQSPTRVSSEVLRNTNLKIVHRIVHPEDQRQIGGAIGLTEQQCGLLGDLARGQAIVSSRTEPSPQTIRVQRAEPVGVATASALNLSTPGWPCCDKVPELHYKAWQVSAQAADAVAPFIVGARCGAGDGRALRAQVYTRLALLATTNSTRSGCLAWVGMRRILVQERGIGVVPSGKAVDIHLRTLFVLWDVGGPVTRQDALDYGVPVDALARKCPYCYRSCGVQVPAWLLLANTPRTALPSLSGSGWRGDLPEVIAWLTTERTRWSALLGEQAADTLLRCQIDQSVQRCHLDRGVADDLARRAGLAF